LATTTTTTTATIDANRAPVVTNPGPRTTIQGVSVVLSLSAVDPDGDPLMWTALNLPPGITLNASTGVLAGVPTTLGAFTVTISASDGWDASPATFTWSIVAPPPPGPTSPVSPSGSIATPTPAFSWSAVGPAAYYALSITDGDTASPILEWYTPAKAGCGTGTCTVPAPRALLPGLVSWSVITGIRPATAPGR
jgi:hypothetical protein